jgi:hypothetical protein
LNHDGVDHTEQVEQRIDANTSTFTLEGATKLLESPPILWCNSFIICIKRLLAAGRSAISNADRHRIDRILRANHSDVESGVEKSCFFCQLHWFASNPAPMGFCSIFAYVSTDSGCVATLVNSPTENALKSPSKPADHTEYPKGPCSVLFEVVNRWRALINMKGIVNSSNAVFAARGILPLYRSDGFEIIIYGLHCLANYGFEYPPLQKRSDDCILVKTTWKGCVTTIFMKVFAKEN